MTNWVLTQVDPDHATRSCPQCLPESTSAELVHGDILRDLNILVDKDRTKLMIIDFDWAGEADVVRYPPYVNHTDVQRPRVASDGLPIKAAHDLEMLAVITEY